MEKFLSEVVDDFLTELGGIDSRRAADLHIEVYDAVSDTWHLLWAAMNLDLERVGMRS